MSDDKQTLSSEDASSENVSGETGVKAAAEKDGAKKRRAAAPRRPRKTAAAQPDGTPAAEESPVAEKIAPAADGARRRSIFFDRPLPEAEEAAPQAASARGRGHAAPATQDPEPQPADAAPEAGRPVRKTAKRAAAPASARKRAAPKEEAAAAPREDAPSLELPAGEARLPLAQGAEPSSSAIAVRGTDELVVVTDVVGDAYANTVRERDGKKRERPGKPGLPPVTLEELPEIMRKAVERAGWSALMPVQRYALPYSMIGRDLMVQSRTGSGKTGAFLLPLLARLDPAVSACQALVLTPTRELAQQVEREARVLFEGTGLKTTVLYGGVGYGPQTAALKAGAQFVVGTPGRILDQLQRRAFTLDNLRALVFDESDRMLSIGFYPDMKELQRYLPRAHVPTQFFSATYPPHVLRLSGEFLKDPQLISLSQNQVHATQIDHMTCECAPMDKDRVLMRLIEVENPTSAIIFCNTKAQVHYVTGVLKGFGYSADELSSDLSQAKREEVLARLRRGEVRFLVATDVAARGIDIPDLSHVFLYEPPEDQESYIHRAGRTGRAGAAGVAISLVDFMERHKLAQIARRYKIDMRPCPVPTDEDVSTAAGRRMEATLESQYRSLGGLRKERIARFLPLAREMAAEENGLLMLAMLLERADVENARGFQSRQPERRDERRDGGRERSQGRSDGGRRSSRSRRRSGAPRGEGAAPQDRDASA